MIESNMMYRSVPICVMHPFIATSWYHARCETLLRVPVGLVGDFAVETCS